MNDDIRELNDAELEAVTGGWLPKIVEMENREQLQALETFNKALYGAAKV